MARKKDEPRGEALGVVGEKLYHLEVLVTYPKKKPTSMESMVFADNTAGAIAGVNEEIGRLYRTKQIEESATRVAYYLRNQDRKLIAKGRYEQKKC